MHSSRLSLVRVILARLRLGGVRCLSDARVLGDVAGGAGRILIQSLEGIGRLGGAIALLERTVSLLQALLISDEAVTFFCGRVTAIAHVLTCNKLSFVV